MPLKTLNTIPPGGYVYIQKDASGKDIATFKSMSPFNEVRQEILKVRVNNNLARATAEEVGEDLEQAQCERLGFDPTFCVSKKKIINFSPAKLFKVSAQHLRESVEGAAERLGQLYDGAHIIAKWFGGGLKPVDSTLSQGRADICTGGASGVPCPNNQPGFKPVEGAAAFIRALSEAKNNLKLQVDGEDKLHTCMACWCHLPTKVHVPLATILADTPQPMLDKIRESKPDCWMITEQLNPAKQ